MSFELSQSRSSLIICSASKDNSKKSYDLLLNLREELDDTEKNKCVILAVFHYVLDKPSAVTDDLAVQKKESGQIEL